MEFEDVLLSERHKSASADRLIMKLYVVIFCIVPINS